VSVVALLGAQLQIVTLLGAWLGGCDGVAVGGSLGTGLGGWLGLLRRRRHGRRSRPGALGGWLGVVLRAWLGV